MEKAVVQRLDALRVELKETKNSMAVKCGINPPTFGRYLSGENKISISVITSVLQKYPDVSADWLLMGEGDMYKKTTELPPVDVSSEESIEHSAEVARLVREKNELIDVNEELREENKRLHAQLEVLKDVLRSSLGGDAVQKVG